MSFGDWKGGGSGGGWVSLFVFMFSVVGVFLGNVCFFGGLDYGFGEGRLEEIFVF